MEETSYKEEQEQTEDSVEVSGEHHSASDNYEDLCGQLAQKERDLVLAAELGKALLESNQELQRRYDAMYEEYSLKVESLQQEKYNLHLELEKVETEHQNKLKDLQDDIMTLREQLQSSNQHQHDNEAETSRALVEAKRKSDYLAEQVQQASKQEEELKQELENEKAKNETNLCVIQDHLEHIAMLREQVEYLSEKLKETTDILQGLEDERDRLLTINEKNLEKLKSYKETVEQRDETIKSQESHIKQLEAQIHSKVKKIPTLNAKQPSQKNHSTVASSHQFNTRCKGRSSKHQPLEQPQCYGETITNSSQLAPLTTLVTEQGGINTPELSPQSFYQDFGSSENLRQSLPHESLLNEFSTTIRHSRNRSDCSVISLSEGSRKRHHETIAGESDDEAECSDKSSKSSVCKQTLYSELMECSGFMPISSKHDNTAKLNLPMDLEQPNSIDRSNNNSNTSNHFLTPPPEQRLDACHSKLLPHSTHSQTSSTPPTPPNDNDIDYDDDVSDNVVKCSQKMNINTEWACHAPMNREASLFEELSSKLSDLDRQNSQTSEKSLFDELSSEMKQKDVYSRDLTSSCLLGHPDSYYQPEGGDDYGRHDGYGQGARQSEDENSYTCEWPLLTSVSADMLDGDDFECDDDDFLVGNVAGSTLSIGDSGVGIVLNTFPSKIESSDVTRRSLEYYGSQVWTGTGMDMDVPDKQDLKEACRLMKGLVERLQGNSEEIEDVSSPENEMSEDIVKDEENEVSFDHLFSLIKQARHCVEDAEHGGVSHLRKFSARQWQLHEMEPVEDFKIPVIECTNRHSQALPQWTKRKELQRSSSSSSLTLRRSL